MKAAQPRLYFYHSFFFSPPSLLYPLTCLPACLVTCLCDCLPFTFLSLSVPFISSPSLDYLSTQLIQPYVTNHSLALEWQMTGTACQDQDSSLYHCCVRQLYLSICVQQSITFMGPVALLPIQYQSPSIVTVGNEHSLPSPPFLSSYRLHHRFSVSITHLSSSSSVPEYDYHNSDLSLPLLFPLFLPPPPLCFFLSRLLLSHSPFSLFFPWDSSLVISYIFITALGEFAMFFFLFLFIKSLQDEKRSFERENVSLCRFATLSLRDDDEKRIGWGRKGERRGKQERHQESKPQRGNEEEEKGLKWEIELR